jgi:hypothetical protein
VKVGSAGAAVCCRQGGLQESCLQELLLELQELVYGGAAGVPARIHGGDSSEQLNYRLA